jgi:hypothetical protein
MFFGRKKESERLKPAGGDEKRKTPRLKLKTLATIRARKGDHHCKIQDLSLGGMSFLYPERLLTADYVSIVLPPPAGVVTRKKVEEAYLEAHVCRVVPSDKNPGQFQIGVRFLSPQDEALETIRLWFESFGEASEAGARPPR